ncbi:hypothetical protein BDV40DRAFT_67138 [Aspergillus tamarii]|uniref:Uncharacterized protein n=1 Tax=Aspergillus tamarii TaxID=41984 RepID=A0A5N6UDZ7_ASPTM|nr:hypothetical protein BDV40DRAFT_67138 [Aspergillus tamarii]
MIPQLHYLILTFALLLCPFGVYPALGLGWLPIIAFISIEHYRYRPSSFLSDESIMKPND